ncbi:MAG: hypothetical protein H6Q88_2649 [Anaeromyxobacteraceae bacterium]|jgi:Ni/Co efflux regulator RcnB|nr:hypothetical protein [Anaeromyxobacteraceae bacterium]
MKGRWLAVARFTRVAAPAARAQESLEKEQAQEERRERKEHDHGFRQAHLRLGRDAHLLLHLVKGLAH